MVTPTVTTGDGATATPSSVAGRMACAVRTLFPWRAVVLPWLASRLLCSAIIVGARSWPLGAGLRFRGFQIWDGVWYTAIARDGYGTLPVGNLQTRWPFFPLVPGIMRGLGNLGLGDQGSMILVNQLALLVAFAGVYRIARRHASPRAASLGVWALAVFPASFVFTMIYPSAIFLAATVWAFIFVEDHQDLAAAGAVVVATLARPNGIFLVLAIAIALRSWRRIALVCVPAIVAAAAWCGWLWDRTGDPLVFYSTKSAWPEVSVADLLTAPWRYDYAWPHVVLGVAAAWVVWHQRRRLPVAWIAWTAVLLVPPLFTGTVGLGRYANDCFPPFVAAGQLLERWPAWARRTAFTLSVLGLVFAGVMVIRYHRIP